VSWAPDYVTLPDMKSYLGIDDTDDDGLLPAWITTASRAVDNYCGRQFGKVDTAEARTYTPNYDPHLGCWVAQIDDLSDDDITVVDSAATVITEYELNPVNSVQKGRPYERLILSRPGPVIVDTDAWGWPAVPAAAKVATQLQCARLVKRRDSPFGIAGSPQADGETTLLYATLDPDLRTSLTGFRRQWWAA
jgi:hypothetical protein